MQTRFEQIAARLAPGGRLVRCWTLAGGISAQMTALEMRDAQGEIRRVVVRQPSEAALAANPHAAADEYRLLQGLQRLGLPAPEPYGLDASGVLLPGPYLVLEYVEGQVDFTPADGERYARRLAEQLAQIHRADWAAQGLDFLPRPEASFEAYCGAPLRIANLPFDVQQVRRRLAASWPLPQLNPPALLHGDYWPGNVLWRAGEIVAVIDWEDAKLGDPLIDLAGCRLELAWLFGHAAMQAFTRRYLDCNPLDTTWLAHWDLVSVLRLARLAFPNLAGWAAFFEPYGMKDVTPQTIREGFRGFVEQAEVDLTSNAHRR